MIIKYCFKDEIHKTFTPPLTFRELRQEVQAIFEKLPPTFFLQYRDSDGDFITISSDKEYNAMLTFDLPTTKASVKIYVIPSHQNEDATKTQRSTHGKSSEESFEIIEEREKIKELSVSELSLNSDISKTEKSVTSSESPKSLRISRGEGNSFDMNDEISSHDLECSMNSHNATLNMIEARAFALKHRTHRAHDLEDDYDSEAEPERADNSLEKILVDIKQPGFIPQIKILPTECYSLENSTISKEIDDVNQEIANIRFRNIIRRLKDLRTIHNYYRSEEESATDESIDLKNIRPMIYDSVELRRSRSQIRNEAARKIQSFFRNFRIRKLLRIIHDKEVSPKYENGALSRHKIVIESPTEICSLCEDFEYCEHNQPNNDTFHDIHFRENAYPDLESDDQKGSSPLSLHGEEYEIESSFSNVNNYCYQLHSVRDNTFICLGAEETRKTVFKTVYIMNTGKKMWRKCYIKSIGALEGVTQEIYNIDVGQLVLITLQLNGDFRVGHYLSQWRIIHENEYGMTEVVGEPFDIHFALVKKVDIFSEIKVDRVNLDFDQVEERQEIQKKEELERKQVLCSGELQEDVDSEEEQEPGFEEEDEETEEEDEDEGEENEDEQDEEMEDREDQENDLTFAKYDDYLEEIAKVKRLSILFPSDPWDEIFDFVAARPTVNANDLLMAYLDYRNGYSN